VLLQATISEIVQHLGMEEFLEVSVKATPEEKFKQGALQLAMLAGRYATEHNPVLPARSWCMTLGAFDSLQVTYQPRPRDECLKFPYIPSRSSGVNEAVKEHLGRVQPGNAAEKAANAVSTSGPASCMLAISAAALAAGSGCVASQRPAVPELVEEEVKIAQNACGDVQQPTAASSICCNVWKEVNEPLQSSNDKRGEEKQDVKELLATAEGRCTETVCVGEDMLAGTVKMDADALAGAASGLHNKQCRMM
jgi:hypothetical protein